MAGAYRYAAMQNVPVSRVPLPPGGFLDRAIEEAEIKLGVTSQPAPEVQVFSGANNGVAPAGRAAFMVRAAGEMRTRRCGGVRVHGARCRTTATPSPPPCVADPTGNGPDVRAYRYHSACA